MYHFSEPSASRNPPEDDELSDPRLDLPLIGVDVPGGDIPKPPRGELTPGDRAKGAVCICDDVLLVFVVADAPCEGWLLDGEVVALVDIDLEFDEAVVF